MKKNSLGRGLDALLNGDSKEIIESQKSNILKEIDIEKIFPNPDQPRSLFSQKEILELSESIKSVGIIEPLITHQKDDSYQIVAGERRWRAAKVAGLKKLPVVVKSDIDDNLMEIMLIENIQREDLTPIEEAKAFQEIINKKNITQENLASIVGKSRSSIANGIRMLNLPKHIQEKINEKVISSGHAKMLAGIKNEKLLNEFYKKILDEKITVNKLEKLISKTNKNRKIVKRNPYFNEMEDQLSQVLKTKIRIMPIKNKVGKIEIEYYNSSDLEDIYEKIKN